MITRTVSAIRLPNFKFSLMRDLFSMTKPRLSSLVIFTCALGLFLAPGSLDAFTIIISILATSGLVGGACIINCYMEREIDAMMERTKTRPLPAGRISPEAAISTGIGLTIFCLVTLYFLVNPLTAMLGLVAAVTYVFLYTPLKKKTSLALFAGAIPGAIPPLMGWTSVTNSVGDMGVALFALLFVWQLPHFLSISIYHADDYKNAGLKTVPAYLGIRGTIHRIVIYTAILLVVSLIPYHLGAADLTFYVAMWVLGGSFLVLSLKGYFMDEKSPKLLRWSRHYFYGSIVYLPLVFILMLVYRVQV